MSDVTFDMRKNEMEVHANHCEAWKVTLLDTGLNTMTGGRLKRAIPYLGGEPFCFTYGDGLSNVNIHDLFKSHKKQGVLATMTAIQPPARFGVLDIEGSKINCFQEKPKGEGGWINGGFFILDPKVIDYIQDDTTMWEREPLERLAAEGQLHAYKHDGFWQALDTLRDKIRLEELWASGKAPWKQWDQNIPVEIEDIFVKVRKPSQVHTPSNV